MTGAAIDEDDDETLNLRIQCQEPEALVRLLELYGPIAHRRNGQWKGYLQIDLSQTDDATAKAELQKAAGE